MVQAERPSLVLGPLCLYTLHQHCWYGCSGLIFCTLPQQPACHPEAKGTIAPLRKWITSRRWHHTWPPSRETRGLQNAVPDIKVEEHRGPVCAGDIMTSGSRQADGCPGVGLCLCLPASFFAWNLGFSVHLYRKEGTAGPCHKQKQVGALGARSLDRFCSHSSGLIVGSTGPLFRW